MESFAKRESYSGKIECTESFNVGKNRLESLISSSSSGEETTKSDQGQRIVFRIDLHNFQVFDKI